MHALGARVASVLRRRLGCDVTAISPVAGGDINDAFRAETTQGPLFVKTRAGAAVGSFRQEAAGLLWLWERDDALPTPEVVVAHDPQHEDDEHWQPGDPRLLALRWIEHGAMTPQAEERLGRGLAHTHVGEAPSFGAAPMMRDGGGVAWPRTNAPMRIGAIELSNQRASTFAEFYAERRLRPLTRMARDAGAFGEREVAVMESIAARMPELAGPRETVARTHGDLWAGNVLVDQRGRPFLIDPVAHGGHREVDLATLRVFGGVGARCFDAYHEIHPLAEGYEDRVALWQLGFVLLHVVLFGGGYTDHAMRLARRYG